MEGQPDRKAFARGGTGQFSSLPAWLAGLFLREPERWFLWVPVLFATGIGAYFSLFHEPSVAVTLAGIVVAVALIALTHRYPFLYLVSLALLCAALGFANAKMRSLLLATPALQAATGAVGVSGWVERAEPRLPKGYRLTIRVISIDGAQEIPPLRKLRVTSRFEPAPRAGEAVRLRAILRPVPEPVMPGGFDFARKAWFGGIGAVGFAITPAQPLAGAPGPGLWHGAKAAIQHLRQQVDARIRAGLAGETGALASALITGERGRIPEPTLEALRHSGLAHLLAISGLHMALMAGTLYWLVRAGLAAVPALALRAPIKKIAAVLALGGAAFYLALSGAGIATQRAFLMITIMFLAILLDRPAITLRNVALAALIVLALFPESLFDVSFQMSFAAAATLVAVYERWSARPAAPTGQAATSRMARKISHYFLGIALTTLVAGLAVAPFAAYHFHKLAQFSLIANLAAMPIFGLAVMPMALGALLAMPLGLEHWPLTVMASGIEGVIAVAREVSGWEGAVIRVPAMPPLSLLAIAAGGLWLVLWRKRWRYAGLVGVGLGLALSGGAVRPDMLIGRDGSLVAVRGGDERLAATTGRAGRYALERWLAADGDAREVDAARGADALSCDAAACIAEIKGKKIALLYHPSALREECARADIVVARFPLGYRCKSPRIVLDRVDFARSGAHALYLDGQSIRVRSVAERRGVRPWTRAASAPVVTAERDRGTARAESGEWEPQ